MDACNIVSSGWAFLFVWLWVGSGAEADAAARFQGAGDVARRGLRRLERTLAEFIGGNPRRRGGDADSADRETIGIQHRHRQDPQSLAQRRIAQRVAVPPDIRQR